MAKKEPIYRGLAELSVQVEDKSINSPDYFRITKIPTEFTAGVNTIKFKGNPSLFVNESQVDIEVLDSNGEPVYYETGLDLESEQQNAVINVYINQDTAPGIGTIYICGTISKDSQGRRLNTSTLNLRWSAPINIDISKRNSVEILYSALPTVTISSTSGAYTNLGYLGGNRIVSQSYVLSAGHLNYLNYNNQPLLSTGSRSTFAFTSSAISSIVKITSSDLTNVNPALPTNLGTLIYSSSIKNYSGSGVAYLLDPIVFNNPNGIENYIVRSATVLGFTYIVEQSASLPSATTENSFNTAVVYFNNLAPESGQVAKIRSYYKSAGVGEYIFSNETDVTSFADEEGFTPNIVTASFAIPTTHRNDRFDFKFEFVNPSGLVSKQVLESKNHLFLGGNTYVGGDDNLLTGSLYVAGSTGTGVHISGKGSAAMIRSIGYAGFQKAILGQAAGGFVMYSGSVQPLLNASESYSGVGLELVANSESYFKYTTSGSGLLDIRTANFFLGNSSNSISGSNGNITISGSTINLSTETFFLGNQRSFISGSLGNIKITTNRVATSSYFPDSFNEYLRYSSGSIVLSGSNINIDTPTIRIGTDANYIQAADGQITIASGYGQIGESYQFSFSFEDPETFQFVDVYDLLPVYGNGSILISGSNVEITTPKFFLGNNSNFVSGSNGNILISGSSVRVATPTFLLGNASTFISGSNGNILISGSSVRVATPTFFLGDSDSFISGSNNNIRISGSNVQIATPSFLLGNTSTFISGSNGNILVSGSNVRIATPTFFLGNARTFISGSNNRILIATLGARTGTDNITISGSDVDILTPTFFLGSTTNFVSGSNGNILISGSNVQVATPTFLLGNTSTFISGSNGNILISGSSVRVATPTFFLGNARTFISGSNNRILIATLGARTGTDNITISGSDVDILTPTFFLGSPTSFVSGSNGNIQISGSAIEIETPTFLLGNASTFISGSNGNILISGSSVRVATPTFFLGNATSFISGSNGNISISGSTVDIETPTFFLGNASNFISGSQGNILISGSNVQVATPAFYLGNSLNYISGSTSRILIATSGSSGSILISGSTVTVATPSFFLGSLTSFVSGSNGNIQISGSAVEIETPTFLLGNASNFISGSNGNILISGSAVTVTTPSFFFGNTSTFISGSRGNIQISGSAVEIETPTFLLGNASTFISGSNGNILISGSSVRVATPTFFLGNATSFISGSNGNILISGSNVRVATNAFLLGNSASFISGSTGNVSIFASKYVLNPDGIVTASGLFVPKSLGTTIIPLINTETGLADSMNMGRMVDVSAFGTTYSNTATVDTPVGVTFRTLYFQKLKGENTLNLSCHFRQFWTGSISSFGWEVGGSGVYMNIYYQTASVIFAKTSSVDFLYDKWTTYATAVTVVTASQLGTPSNPTYRDNVGNWGTWNTILAGPSSKNYTLPTTGLADSAIYKVELYWSHNLFVDTPTVSSTLNVRFLNVQVGRNLGMNYGRQSLGVATFASIGAAPAVVVTDPPDTYTYNGPGSFSAYPF
jgi:hypothetical protein